MRAHARTPSLFDVMEKARKTVSCIRKLKFHEFVFRISSSLGFFSNFLAMGNDSPEELF